MTDRLREREADREGPTDKQRLRETETGRRTERLTERVR